MMVTQEMAKKVGNHQVLMPAPYSPMCLLCGAIYVNLLLHVEWHEELEKKQTKAKQLIDGEWI